MDSFTDEQAIERELIGRVHLDEVHKAARARLLNDATGSSFDDHVLRVTLEAAAAIIRDTVRAEVAKRDAWIARAKTDHGRMLWRDDVEGICPSIDLCFEYGEHVRCGPCAIKAAARDGVQVIDAPTFLPEVARLKRELRDLQEPTNATE